MHLSRNLIVAIIFIIKYTSKAEIFPVALEVVSYSSIIVVDSP